MPEELTEDRAAEIRDQERRKLQGIIDKLTRERDDLQNDLKSFESKSDTDKSTDKESAKIAKTLERLEKLLGKEDTPNMPELKEIKDMLAQMSAPKDNSDIDGLKEQVAELSKAIQDEKKRNSDMAKDLSAKQKRLMVSEAIRTYGKPVIEELIGGDTEEEIQASIEKAAQRYEAIVNSVLEKNKPATEQSSEQKDTPADNDTTTETQPVAGDNRTPESPETPSQTPQPHATGSGPTPSGGPSQTELLETLNSLSGKEKIEFFKEHRDALQKMAERQATG